MAGVQTAIDMETGEMIDEEQIRKLYTETSVTGKQMIDERCKLGERIRINAIAIVVATGQALDNDGNKIHVQKVKVVQVTDVERGAI